MTELVTPLCCIGGAAGGFCFAISFGMNKRHWKAGVAWFVAGFVVLFTSFAGAALWG